MDRTKTVTVEVRRRRRERERLVMAMKEEEETILQTLSRRGIHVTAVDELAKEHAPLSADIVDVLLDAVPTVENPVVLESLIRMLTATRVEYDAAPLLELFDASKDEYLKWVIANTLWSSGPKSIAPWLESALRNPEHGTGRQMLCYAAAKLMLQDAARRVLRELFEEFPGHAAAGLAQCGTVDDVVFLQSWVARVEMAWIRREIQKAIARIEKREAKRRHGRKNR